MRRLLLLLTGAALLAAAPAPAGAAGPGPALTGSRAAQLAAITCAADVARAPRTPILLVHGTGVTARENWDSTYGPELTRLGHGVCTVDLPDRAFGDVQATVEYVVTAIREVARRAGGRRISILGHSQGAFQPVFALRVWPDLAGMVDDFIGLAGAYDNGSEFVAAQCRSQEGCVPAFHQVGTGAAFLMALRRHEVPAGPSYTAIATLADEVVTPQPKANELARARSIQVQDICPGRAMPTEDHVLLAGDAVAYELVRDALAHEGPADSARISRGACDRTFFDGVDFATFALALPGMLGAAGEKTHTVPPLRCYLVPACTDVDARGRVIGATTVLRGSCARGVRVRLTAHMTGRVRLRLRRHGLRRVLRTVTRRVTAGATTAVTVPASGCRARSGRRFVVDVVTRPDASTADAVERRLGVTLLN